MKKVLFLLLLFVGLGAANVSAQVRIGGDGEPHTAAVLDLNVDDTDDGNKGALALPRVSLATNTDELNGATPLTGMLVYNTNASMIDGSGIGVYFFDEGEWVKIRGNGTITSTDLADNVVTTSKIANNAVSFAKLKTISGTLTVNFSSSAVATYATADLPAGCNWDNTSFQKYGLGDYVNCWSGSGARVYCQRTTASSSPATVVYMCFQ